jgi:hypothetical protein
VVEGLRSWGETAEQNVVSKQFSYASHGKDGDKTRAGVSPALDQDTALRVSRRWDIRIAVVGMARLVHRARACRAVLEYSGEAS